MIFRLSFIRNGNYSIQYSYSSTLAVAISRIRAFQRYKFLLPYFQLDWTAKGLKLCFRTSVLSWLLKILSYASALPLCIDCQRSEVTLPHCLDYQWCDMSSVPHFSFANSSKDVDFRFCTAALPGLLKVWSFASTLLLCLDCQRCEVPLSKLLFCQDFEISKVPLPHLFDQDF